MEPGSKLSIYSLAEGNTISVVRRIGKAKSAAPPPKSTPPPTTTTTSAASVPAPIVTDAETEQAPQPPSLEEMMRSMNMSGQPPNLGGGGGANAGMPGLGGMANMPDLSALMGGGAGAGGMEQLIAQLPQMMNGLMKTPMLQDYLSNPDKQEQSRDAILNNPLLKGFLESDPEFARVVNDPEKWRASMEAAKSLFNAENAPEASTELDSDTPVNKTIKKASAADVAPAGIDVKKLSESYGHALGQSLVNSGLGLDPDLVIKGLKSAVDGKPFPMSLPEYERSMAVLQNLATEFLNKANMEDANNFFEELGKDGRAVILEEGKIAYETPEEDVGMKTDGSLAKEKATVLVIVTARLLDGRHFFTCPAADESGDSVHPLTLPLETAPRALAKGIVGMKESEHRLLYVHPSACEGMGEMFGDMLPPNALLIFDLQLISANAPDEETVGESYYNSV